MTREFTLKELPHSLCINIWVWCSPVSVQLFLLMKSHWRISLCCNLQESNFNWLILILQMLNKHFVHLYLCSLWWTVTQSDTFMINWFTQAHYITYFVSSLGTYQTNNVCICLYVPLKPCWVQATAAQIYFPVGPISLGYQARMIAMLNVWHESWMYLQCMYISEKNKNISAKI